MISSELPSDGPGQVPGNNASSGDGGGSIAAGIAEYDMQKRHASSNPNEAEIDNQSYHDIDEVKEISASRRGSFKGSLGSVGSTAGNPNHRPLNMREPPSIARNGVQPPSAVNSIVGFDPRGDLASIRTTIPGDADSWVVSNHRHNLISAVKMYPTNSWASTVRLGSLKTSRPPPDSEAQTSTANIGTPKTTRPNGDSGAQASEPRGPWVRPQPQNETFRIHLVELQRIRLRKLQCRLVKHTLYMRENGTDSAHWETDLQDYTRAYQDYEYMIQCSRMPRDPFHVTGERKTDAYVIDTTLQKMNIHLEHKDLPAHEPIMVRGPWEEDWLPIGGPRDLNLAWAWKAGFKKRIVTAAMGGLFLIGPMWLMVLRNGLYTNLLAATVFVSAFGVLMAWQVDQPKEVMSNTAAYAAVLVVFVGLTNTGSDGQTQATKLW
ncbi:hypothetical protein F4778DRAFT_445296 [Xylariomycetidae sp. FL2044]|nr:hypothetical protein F4778DRAFT_445296 [Xylariomycetidae sp. FL2044]